MRPLETLLNKTRDKQAKWEWCDIHNEAFNKLKELLTSAPILAYPQKNEQFILDTDASATSVAAVISQVQAGKERVIAYASHTLTKHERRYCTTRRELLAVYKYVKQFKHYLMGKQFVLRTDHKSLTWLMDWKEPSTSQYCSWILELQEFDFIIEHRKGDHHGNADSLSRYPECQQCGVNHIDPKNKRNVKEILQFVNIVDEPVEFIKQIIINKDQDTNLLRNIDDLKNDEIRYWSKCVDYLTVINKELFIKRNMKLLKVPPKRDRCGLIENIHKELSHVGVTKCLQRIKNSYFWPNMDEQITSIIRSCKKCQMYKPNHTKKQAYGKLNADYIFETISIDIMGPFKRTPEGFTYLLGIIDNYSKYIMLCPLKNLTSNTVIKCLENKWINLFGAPEKLHSDNASIFKSEEFLVFCKMYNIIKTYSAPYWPQSDGMIERIFKTIKPLIAIELQDSKNKYWTDTLCKIEIAMRNTITKSSNSTPSFKLFGKELRHKFDVPEAFKSSADEKKSFCETSMYKIGDLVLVKVIESEGKTYPKYNGPYQVIEVIGNKIYRLNKGNEVITRSGQHLKRYYRPNLPTETSQTSIISKTNKIHTRSAEDNLNDKQNNNIQINNQFYPILHEDTIINEPYLIEENQRVENRYPQRNRVAPKKYGFNFCERGNVA